MLFVSGRKKGDGQEERLVSLAEKGGKDGGSSAYSSGPDSSDNERVSGEGCTKGCQGGGVVEA